jgi:hypothetical protein
MSTSHVSVPVPTDLFLDLAAFLRGKGSKSDPVEVIAEAVGYWMENATWKLEDLLPDALGYYWKELFLPHGTRLRMRYKGQYHYCGVDGDQLIFRDRAVSPSEFANKVTGTPRNAWRDLEIRRPNDDDWLPADQLRGGSKSEPDIED